MHAAGKGLAAVAATVVIVASLAPARAQRLPGVSDAAMAALARGEWPAYAGTYAAAKYSPLDQINAGNVKDLQIAWRWTSPDHALRAATSGIDREVLRKGSGLGLQGGRGTSVKEVPPILARRLTVRTPSVYGLSMS